MTTKEEIKKWYQSSSEWKKCSRYIRTKYRGICQSCRKAGREVHHIVPLTTVNFQVDSIRTGESNLTLLCTSCHNAQRRKYEAVRSDVDFDEEGNLIKKVI